MGAYLSIELHTEYKLYQGYLEEAPEMNIDEYVTALAESEAIALELFDVIKEEEDRTYIIRLKDDAVVKDLLPFMRQFCEDYYESEKEYGKALEQLSHCNSYEELEALLPGDNYPLIRNHVAKKIYFQGRGISDVVLYSEGLMLTLEGKVFAEEMDKSLNFFEKMIKRAYLPDFPIAKSITVSIV